MDIGQKVMIGVVLLVVFVGGYLVFKPSQDVTTEEDSPSVITPAAPQPIAAANAVYTLGGVHWIFEPQAPDENGAPTTRVRLQLDEFRRNGSLIDVAYYRLGTYRGSCQDAPVATSAMLALAQCQWGEVVRQIAAFQEDSSVVVHVRTLGADGVPREEFVPILSIDLTRIVEPAS